jgi:protein-disulfide isomerase
MPWVRLLRHHHRSRCDVAAGRDGEIAFRFYDLPLDMHRNAVPAHNAAHCANEQGKFWEMHDALFAGQFDWNSQATRTPKKVFEKYAGAIGLDTKQWNECYDSERMLPQILANREEAVRLRVGSTPTFVIGGQMVAGSIPFDEFRRLVEQAKARSAAAAPASPTAR